MRDTQLAEPRHASPASGPHYELSRLKRGVLAVFAGTGLQSAAGFLATLIMSRLVTASELGAYFVLIQVIAVAILASEAGTVIGMQKLVGSALATDDWGRARRDATSVFIAVGATTVLVSLVLATGWRPLTMDLLHQPDLAPMLYIAILWLVFRGTEDLSSAFLRSIGEVKRAALSLGVPRQVFMVTCLAVVLSTGRRLDLPQLALLGVTSFALSAAIGAATFARRIRGISQTTRGSWAGSVRAVFALSLPMMMNAGAAVVLGSADIWVLAIFRSGAEVGTYGLVVRLVTMLAAVLTMVNMVLPPTVARLFAANRLGEMEYLLRRSATWAAAVAGPAAAALVLGGASVLSVAYGEEYSAGAPALAVLAIAHAVSAASGSPGYVLQMTGHQRLLMKVTMVVAAGNLAGNLLVVEAFGMTGVAAVTAVALVSQNLFMMGFLWKRMRIRTHVLAPSAWLTRKELEP